MDIQYEKLNDQYIRITKFSKPEKKLIIPNEIDDFTVTEIGKDIFITKEKSIIEEICLPETIECLNEYAFYDLKYLKKINIPSTMKKLSSFSIFTCPDLASLYIPTTVQILEDYSVGFMYEHGRAYKQNYFTFICEENSIALEYATKYNLNVKIGQLN